jgi:hypothetical protein
MLFAGQTVTRAQIAATVRLLKYYRKFVRQNEFEKCKNPEDRYGVAMTKGEAQARLMWLVDMAINRKAGRADVPGRKWESDWQAKIWRDCCRVRDIARRVRVYQFETEEVRKRFSHLLSDRSE